MKWLPLKLASATPLTVIFSPCRKLCTSVVVKVTVPAERLAPAGAGAMVRVSVELVRYLMTGVMNPAGWLFSYWVQPAWSPLRTMKICS